MLHNFNFLPKKEENAKISSMKTFFQDEFMNGMLLKKLVREVKKEQLNKTISEIDYLNELQSHVVSRCDFTAEENQELEFIKKINNAKRKNLQA